MQANDIVNVLYETGSIYLMRQSDALHIIYYKEFPENLRSYVFQLNITFKDDCKSRHGAKKKIEFYLDQGFKVLK